MKSNQKLPQFIDKNSVIKFEFNNLTHIILQNIGHKNEVTFWHATMNSALIMKYHIGSQAKTHFMVDYYMSNMFRLYICYTNKHIPSIIKILTQSGHKPIRQDEQFIVFELDSPVDAKLLRQWKKDEELIKSQIEETYQPNRNTKYVELYKILRELGDEIRLANRQMDGADRMSLGIKMMDWLVQAYQEYNYLPENTTEFMKHINNISFLADVCGVKQVINDKRLLKIGQLINDIREYLKRQDAKRR